ncbi:MAG: hypothetical protein KME43_06430 [Myxacorys chilensis ATA2-1-KO14]|jgi:hypothetical protein|nr:hypothetical protein [Myxacorys chilensis ATA2-1-KO14]
MASNGRYQSHLLSFLSRQRQKIADKTSVLLRQAKLTTLWSAQILLYPVYAVYQTTRLVGRQLKQTAQRATFSLKVDQGSPHSAPPERLESDTSIQRVLSAVAQAVQPELHEPQVTVEQPRRILDFLLLPVTVVRRFLSPASVNLSDALADVSPAPITSASSTSIAAQASETAIVKPRLPIQAIASLLDTRNLVLILNGNVILDTLTPDQQHQIQQRIIFELALYRHWCKQQSLGASSPLPLPDDRPTILPPVRIFRQLMAWVQTGPIAIATNLFQESALATTYGSDGTVIQSPTGLDWFVPNISGSDISWNVTPPKLPSAGDLKTAFGQLPRWTDLEALVWAAIHYFFGGQDRRFAPSYPYLGSTTEDLGGTTEASDPQLTAKSNWLSWSDLFGRPPAYPTSAPEIAIAGTLADPVSLKLRSALIAQDGLRPEVTSRTQPRLAPRSKILLGRSFKQWLQRYFNARTSVVVHQPIELKVDDPIEKGNLTIRDRQPSHVEITAPASINPTPSEVEESLATYTSHSATHTPDWIETDAIAAGYVKSPVQRVMSWLDHLVSWVEAKLIAVWNWLTARES